MKNSLFLLMAAALLSSCSSVYFQSAQPGDAAAASNFPAQWRGEYRIANEGESGSETFVSIGERTVLFTGVKTRYEPYQAEPGLEAEEGDSVQMMIDDSPMWGVVEGSQVRIEVRGSETLGLSDSLILKISGSGAFINLAEEKNGQKLFTPFLLERLRNGDLILWGAMEEKEGMEAYFPLIRQTASQGDAEMEYFVANPSAKQWNSFISSGGLKQVVYWLEKQ